MSWLPDIWGGVRRNIEANKAATEYSAAQVAAVRLTAQGELAQDYFQLRALDMDYKILMSGVAAYKKTLELTKHQYQVGTASLANVVQAEAQLKTAEAQAIDTRVNRALFEHAIAVLIGQPPAAFSIPFLPMNRAPPRIPIEVPSTLLERRPDIAAAERQVAQANAQVGVAIAAFFPVLNLTATGGYQSNKLSRLFSLPTSYWSLAANLTETLFNGGLRIAQTRAAKAVFFQAIYNYRQTVLAAFQNVEDNLSTLRVLEEEEKVAAAAARAQKIAMNLSLEDFKAGTAAYTQVLIAEVNYYIALQTAADINGRRMVAASNLIMALGGNWHAGNIAVATHISMRKLEHLVKPTVP